ncbi:GNAT family N-acetyltransferase [Nocardioides sp.]|uniref:GNAT family N-acetyltransferase n=1 Tax=Nocardioides sp. TaxID=35761 RepID=UPI003517F365
MDFGTVTLRPLTSGDAPVAERLSDDAFLAVAEAARQADDPPAARRGDDGSARWTARTRHLVDTDPDGCWAAEMDGELVGFATSLRRESLWCLGSFAVRPGLQGHGIGRRLLAAVEEHGRGCTHAMLCASPDPAAVRSYHRAGFHLHPRMQLTGRVEASRLPAVGAGVVHVGDHGDRDWMDDLDRELRGGAHGTDHAVLSAEAVLLVHRDRAGYVYASGRRVDLLAARDETSARSLLVEVLGGAACAGPTSGPEAPPAELLHVTSENQWAVDVGLSAGLGLGSRGYLAVRGLAVPAPYLPHGVLL